MPFLLLRLPGLPDHQGGKGEPDLQVGVEVVAVFVNQASSPVVDCATVQVGDGAFFAVEGGSTGGVTPGQGDVALFVGGLADKRLAVRVVVSPFLGGGVVGIHFFGDAGQTVEIMFGVGEGPALFVQYAHSGRIIQGVGGGSAALCQLQTVACAVVGDKGGGVDFAQAHTASSDEQVALVVTIPESFIGGRGVFLYQVACVVVAKGGVELPVVSGEELVGGVEGAGGGGGGLAVNGFG